MTKWRCNIESNVKHNRITHKKHPFLIIFPHETTKKKVKTAQEKTKIYDSNATFVKHKKKPVILFPFDATH